MRGVKREIAGRHHDDLRHLHRHDNSLLADAVGQIARKTGEEHKGKGEQGGREILIVLAPNRLRHADQQHQLFEQIVVEGPEELREVHPVISGIAPKRRTRVVGQCGR